MRHSQMVLMAVAATLGAGTAAAAEGWRLCNATSYVVEAAAGRPEPSGVHVRGWLRLRPGECRAASPAPLARAAHHLFARSSDAHRGPGRLWRGSEPFCVDYHRDFALRQPAACTGRGEETAGFVPVSIGKTGGHTTWLHEPASYTLEQARTAGIQRLLSDTGVAEMRIDGRMGRHTRRSIETFLQDRRLPAGIVGADLIDVLEKAARRAADRFGFDLCNRAGARLWVAIAAEREQGWESRGWWPLEPGACVRAIDRPLEDRPHYVYAEPDMPGYLAGGRLRAASRTFCVARTRFAISGEAPCRDRHYDEAGFAITGAAERGRLAIEFRAEDFVPPLVAATGDAGR